MTTSIVTTTEAWNALEDRWRKLLDSCANPAVTLTWPWLDTWWSVFGDATRELRVVVVEEQGEVIGAAPLLRRTSTVRRYGWLQFRRLELLASGEEAGSPICSDYIGWPALPGREADVAHRVFRTLTTDMSGEWDELVLPDMNAESAMVPAIVEAARASGLSVVIDRREPAAVLDLAPDWDAMLARLGSSLRYKVRRGQRELTSRGGGYSSVTSADEDWKAAFDQLVTLHQARWTAKGKPGAFRHPRRLAFHTTVIPRLLEEGTGRLGLLRVDEQVVGAVYNTMFRGHVGFYQSGIQPMDSSHLRPGLLLHAFEVEAAIARGDAEYDFLKRGHSDYKDSWTSRTRDLIRLRIGRPGLRDSAYHASAWAVAQARSLKHALEERRANGDRKAQG